MVELTYLTGITMRGYNRYADFEHIDDYYRRRDAVRHHTDEWQDDDGEDAHGRGGNAGGVTGGDGE